MAVEVQNFRAVVARSLLVFHKVNAEAEEAVLRHALVLGGANAESTWILLVVEVFWASVGVGKAFGEPGGKVEFVVNAVRLLVLLCFIQ